MAKSVDRGGAESWANQAIYAVGASVEPPPDEVNLNGQNWGLPPIRPGRLRAEGYDSFIATLRASMRYARAVRVDHVMGLARLYWIPPGASASEGAPMAAQMTPELTCAIHEYLARTPARGLVIQLEDMLGLREQANLPRTTNEHPNWRRKLPLTLEQIERDERFHALTETLARVRPAP